MNTKNTLKLKVFESGFSKETQRELLTVLETATTIEDLDAFNTLYTEKAREITYELAATVAANEKYTKNLRESEYAKEFPDVIELMEKYLTDCEKLIKTGASDTECVHVFEEHSEKVMKALDRKTLKIQMEIEKLALKSAPSHDEVKEMEAKLKEANSFKGKVKDVLGKIKENTSKAAKAAKDSASEGKDKLSEKAEDLKKKIGELKSK